VNWFSNKIITLKNFPKFYRLI